MHTWAKRGLQTALVTGGLLMLGTGIASADEDVNPDKPVSPLDLNVIVPIKTDNNAIGTPLGQLNLPNAHRDLAVNPGDVANKVPVANSVVPGAMNTAGGLAAPVVGQAAPVAAAATDQAAPLTRQAAPLTGGLNGKAAPITGVLNGVAGRSVLPELPEPKTSGVPATQYGLRDNRIDGDLIIPVDLSGNAIGLLGDAYVVNESHQDYATDESVEANGACGFIAGNVVDLDYALPVQVNGNALGVLGHATAVNESSQSVSNTSNVTTTGAGGILAGNGAAVHGATPVQVTGNGIAAIGTACAESTATSTAEAGGWLLTNGEHSLAGGNLVGVPVAVPVLVNGNGIAALGHSSGESEATADAIAGAERPGLYGVPTYLETDGSPGLLAGNVAQPAVSGPALICGNAAAVVGTAAGMCDNTTVTTAGGGNRTSGAESVLSGAVAAVPAAVPAEVFGNAGSVLGRTEAEATNSVASTAGGDSYTRGHESILGGGVASVAPTGPVDLFSNAVAAGGDASSTAVQEVDLGSSGHLGTTGDDSVGGGNMAEAPVVVPVEGFGNVVGALGEVDSFADETKTTDTGGGGSTQDDHGLLASNLLTTPVAGAAQIFGNGAGAVADTDSTATTDTEVSSGGDSKATGKLGTLSGNLGQVPVSLPAQVFGTGANAGGHGKQTAANDTSMTAGGDAVTEGQGGLGSGNVVSGPVGSAAQGFGESVAVLGTNQADTVSTTDSTSGGDVESDGTGGVATGNVVSPQALPVVQSFAATVAGVNGGSASLADNDTVASSGGDIDTVGDHGFLAGNVVDSPIGGMVQPFGDAVSAVDSISAASGNNISDGTAGGTSTTSGTGGSLSGIDGTIPLAADAPVYDVPVEVLAEAVTDSTDAGSLEVGESDAPITLPLNSGVTPTAMPSLLPMSQDARAMRTATPVALPTGASAAQLPAIGQLTGVLDLTKGGLPLPRTGANPFGPITGDLFDLDVPTASNPLGGSLVQAPSLGTLPSLPTLG